MSSDPPLNPPDAPARRGICLVLVGPSGAGKSSILRALLTEEPALRLSVSATTRAPRPGERHGVDYHFTEPAAFATMAASGDMLEWAEVFGRAYGTPRAPVEAALAAGNDVAFDIDWQGHRQVRAALPGDVVGVFLLPPTVAALETRLRGRQGDSPDEIARRMNAAKGEIGHWDEFDHVVVNRDFDDAKRAVQGVLHAARSARTRQPGLPAFVARLLAI